MELDDKIYEKVTNLCDEGEDLLEEGKYDNALKKYVQALNLLPLPKEEWEASTWIYTTIGDTYFSKKDYRSASTNFYNALNCPDGINNPFILLRLGQSLFEIRDLDKAKEYLLRAYMLEGYKIFNSEDDKYINLILDLI